MERRETTVEQQSTLSPTPNSKVFRVPVPMYTPPPRKTWVAAPKKANAPPMVEWVTPVEMMTPPPTKRCIPAPTDSAKASVRVKSTLQDKRVNLALFKVVPKERHEFEQIFLRIS